MREAKTTDGSGLFNTASVMAILVFFMIAMQCLSTFAIARKEESDKFAWLQLIGFNIVAYVTAVLTYQLLI